MDARCPRLGRDTEVAPGAHLVLDLHVALRALDLGDRHVVAPLEEENTRRRLQERQRDQPVESLQVVFGARGGMADEGEGPPKQMSAYGTLVCTRRLPKIIKWCGPVPTAPRDTSRCKHDDQKACAQPTYPHNGDLTTPISQGYGELRQRR